MKNSKSQIGEVFELVKNALTNSSNIDRNNYQTDNSTITTATLKEKISIAESVFSELPKEAIANQNLMEATEMCLENLANLIFVKSSIDPLHLFTYAFVIDYITLILKFTSKVKTVSYIDSNFSLLSPLRSKYELTLGNVSKSAYEEKSSDADRLMLDLIRKYKNVDRNNILLLCDDFIGQSYSILQKMSNEDESLFKLNDQQHFIDVRIRIGSIKPSQAYKTLWLIHESLSKIKGVSTQTFNIKKGSIIEEFFIWADDLVAKEEVKSVLSNALRPQKSEEKKKTVTPRKRKRNIEAELKEEELTKMKLENLKLISELVAKGVFECDDIKIDINGINAINITGGIVHVNPAGIDTLID